MSAAAPVFRSSRTQLTCSFSETEHRRAALRVARRVIAAEKVRRVSRDRPVSEERSLSASVVIEITRSQRGSLAAALWSGRGRSSLRPNARWIRRKLHNDAQGVNDAGAVHLFEGVKRVYRFRSGGSQSPWGRWCRAARPGGEQKQRSAGEKQLQARDARRLSCPTSPTISRRAARSEQDLAEGQPPALMRLPRRANTAGTTVLAINTLMPATRNPATPMERISLMGTVRRARKPIATVEAEIKSVRPA